MPGLHIIFTNTSPKKLRQFAINQGINQGINPKEDYSHSNFPATSHLITHKITNISLSYYTTITIVRVIIKMTTPTLTIITKKL